MEVDKLRFILYVLSILFVASVIVNIIFYVTSIKLKDIKIDRYIGEIIAISNDLNRLKNDNYKLRESVNQYIKDHFSTINSLCRDYFIGDNSDAQKVIIYHTVEKEIAKLQNKDHINRLEDLINENNNGIITNLRNHYPDMTEEAITLCVLFYAGFTPKTISVITGIKLKTIYTKRSRLKQKFESDDWIGSNTILNFLC